MACCGNKRAAVTAQTAARRNIQPYTSAGSPQTATQVRETGTIALRYLGATAISLRGPNSGQVYYFESAGAVVSVQRSDVDALLRTQLFTDIQE